MQPELHCSDKWLKSPQHVSTIIFSWIIFAVNCRIISIFVIREYNKLKRTKNRSVRNTSWYQYIFFWSLLLSWHELACLNYCFLIPCLRFTYSMTRQYLEVMAVEGNMSYRKVSVGQMVSSWISCGGIKISLLMTLYRHCQNQWRKKYELHPRPIWPRSQRLLLRC